jgi:ketosteroid isomerase-like protein
MHETEKVLRAAATAMTTGDMDGLSALFAGDVVVHVPGTNQLSGDHKGKEAAFTGYMGKVMALTNGEFVFEPHDIAGSEDHAAGIYRYRATHRHDARVAARQRVPRARRADRGNLAAPVRFRTLERVLVLGDGPPARPGEPSRSQR